MKFQILTVIWGNKHFDWFSRGLLASLQQEDLSGATWNIFTDDIQRMTFALLDRFGSSGGPNIKVRSVNTLRKYIDQTQSAMVWQVEECLKLDEKLIIAPPDTIFSKGSLANLLKYDKCIAVAHPRVLPSLLDTTDLFLDLASNAWKHLHESWIKAEQGCKGQSTFMGGVMWKKRQVNTEVTHLLPTVYMCKFTPDDLRFFKNAPSFGSFDHEWPSFLVSQDRVDLIRDSDEAFICELTEPDKNVPPWHHSHPIDGTFWRDGTPQAMPHNAFFKKRPVTFRV
ncbi:MAG TPA: hypothetical protein PLQ20_02075 [Candidatus Paceibacterota bacterium]|nr:hypothetical protein [Candidatus Paceibacterota bacterium]